MKNLVLREKRNLRQQEKENFKNKNNNILAGKIPAIFIFVGADDPVRPLTHNIFIPYDLKC